MTVKLNNVIKDVKCERKWLLSYMIDEYIIKLDCLKSNYVFNNCNVMVKDAHLYRVRYGCQIVIMIKNGVKNCIPQYKRTTEL